MYQSDVMAACSTDRKSSRFESKSAIEDYRNSAVQKEWCSRRLKFCSNLEKLRRVKRRCMYHGKWLLDTWSAPLANFTEATTLLKVGELHHLQDRIKVKKWGNGWLKESKQRKDTGSTAYIVCRYTSTILKIKFQKAASLNLPKITSQEKRAE